MTHLQRETDRLKRKILALGALVEENLRLAFQAIEQRDAAKARRVVETDVVIDQNEVEIEEDCLKILALYQPVAGDLRFVAAVIKINSELERIGDLAENIAKRALQLLDEPPIQVPHTVAVMADRTETILEHALDALVRQDAVTAREVLVADQEIDALYRQLIDELKAHAPRPPRPPGRDGPSVQRGPLPRAAGRPRHQHRGGRPLHGRGLDPATLHGAGDARIRRGAAGHARPRLRRRDVLTP